MQYLVEVFGAVTVTEPGVREALLPDAHHEQADHGDGRAAWDVDQLAREHGRLRLRLSDQRSLLPALASDVTIPPLVRAAASWWDRLSTLVIASAKT